MGKPINRRSCFDFQFIPDEHPASVIEQNKCTLALGHAVVIVCIQHIHHGIATVVVTFVRDDLALGIKGLSTGGARLDYQSILSLCPFAVVGPAFAIFCSTGIPREVIVIRSHFCDPPLSQSLQNKVTNV